MRSLAPATFVARTTLPRRALSFASHDAMYASVRPCVSASVGTGYISFTYSATGAASQRYFGSKRAVLAANAWRARVRETAARTRSVDEVNTALLDGVRQLLVRLLFTVLFSPGHRAQTNAVNHEVAVSKLAQRRRGSGCGASGDAAPPRRGAAHAARGGGCHGAGRARQSADAWRGAPAGRVPPAPEVARAPGAAPDAAACAPGEPAGGAVLGTSVTHVARWRRRSGNKPQPQDAQSSKSLDGVRRRVRRPRAARRGPQRLRQALETHPSHRRLLRNSRRPLSPRRRRKQRYL